MELSATVEYLVDLKLPCIYMIIDYITITTTGNAIDFGNLSAANYIRRRFIFSSRIVFAGGIHTPSTKSNVIDYINIQTEGNSVDFGDLTTMQDIIPHLFISNGHGGL